MSCNLERCCRVLLRVVEVKKAYNLSLHFYHVPYSIFRTPMHTGNHSRSKWFQVPLQNIVEDLYQQESLPLAKFAPMYIPNTKYIAKAWKVISGLSDK